MVKTRIGGFVKKASALAYAAAERKKGNNAQVVAEYSVVISKRKK